MTASSDFDAAWQELRRRAVSGDVASVKSYMWEKWVKDFAADASPADVRARIFKVNQNRAYNFLAADEDRRSDVAVERLRLRTTAAISRVAERIAARFWSANAKSPRIKHLKGYPRVEPLLRRLGLWDEYVETCARLRVSNESFNTAKSFYVSSLVKRHLPAPTPGLRILEIGGGTGVLSVLLRTRLDVHQYAIVDLPEMLLQSSMVVHHFFPKAPAAFSAAAGGAMPLPAVGGLFVVPSDVSALADNQFDVCVNIDSFQEMDRDQVHGYLALMRRVIKPGGLLLTINRRKQVRDFDNNPLLYPYGASEVLQWEVDPFFYEGLGRVRKDAHLVRAERVRKP